MSSVSDPRPSSPRRSSTPLTRCVRLCVKRGACVSSPCSACLHSHHLYMLQCSPSAARRWLLLHRHQPGRPQRRSSPRCLCLQLSLCQLALGRRARHLRARRPLAPAPRPLVGAQERRLAKGFQGLLRDPRQDPRYHWLRPHRKPAFRSRREYGHERPLLRRAAPHASRYCTAN